MTKREDMLVTDYMAVCAGNAFFPPSKRKITRAHAKIKAVRKSHRWWQARHWGDLGVDLTSGDIYGGWLSRRRIRRRAGDVYLPYLTRVCLLPRNRFFNAYLHFWEGSDNYEVAVHDHPWWSLSFLLRGELLEWYNTPMSDDGKHFAVFPRCVPFFRPCFRRANFAHAIQVLHQPRPPLTLFLTGPVRRKWNFFCVDGVKKSATPITPADFHAEGGGCGE